MCLKVAAGEACSQSPLVTQTTAANKAATPATAAEEKIFKIFSNV